MIFPFLRVNTDGGTKKYVFHDEPHSFETSMDYLVVASNNNSMSEHDDMNNSVASNEANGDRASASEHIYSNSHFKFEVLETTVWVAYWVFFAYMPRDFSVP